MGFFDKFKSSKSKKSVLRGEDARNIISKLCSLRENVLISTSISNVAADFLGITDNEVLTRSTLSRDEAIYLLKNAELKLKFSYVFKAYEGKTRLTGLTLFNNIPALKFQIPEEIVEQEHRFACRVDNIGNIPVTFSTSKMEIIRARVMDISISGIAIVPQKRIRIEDHVAEHDIVNVDLKIRDITLKNRCEVTHLRGNKIGCRFLDLTEENMEKLKLFIEERIQAKLESMERALEIKVGREKGEVKKPEVKKETSTVILISRDSELFGKVTSSLKRKFTVYSSDPVLENVKSAINLSPHIILLHVEDTGIDSMTLAKRISYVIRSFVPFILIGDSISDEKKSDLITATGAITYIDIENYNSLSFYKTVRSTYKSIYS